VRVAFSGPAQIGKTTCAQYLQGKYGGTCLSFAKRLKMMAHTVGWDGKKDFRGRKLLQDLGLVVREYDPEYWIDSLLVEMYRRGLPSEEDNYFVDDLRFKNEAETLKREGFVLVRLQSDLPYWTGTHPSEVSLVDYTHDHYIVSTRGDIQGMLAQVEEVLGLC